MKTRQGGFTLIEALVVVFVIGLLIALVLPAVQSSRESARRLECANHLKQLGIALAQHHSEKNRFPSSMAPRWKMPKRQVFGSDLPGLYDLLPSIGEGPLFNSFNVSIDDGGLITVSLSQNETAKGVRVGTFLCPSDANGFGFETAPNSYRFNVGVANYPFEDNTGDYLGKGAAFAIGKFFSAADFMDGLSNTVGMSERLMGSGATARFDPTRDFWYADVVGLVVPQTADQIRGICGALRGTPQDYYTEFGKSWCEPTFSGTWYNHVESPNAKASDCSAEHKPASPSYEIAHYCSVSAKCAHPGSVHSLMMDGSVRFIKNGVNLTVWRAIGTRSGAEAVDATSY